jgi:BirA family transcriptional regulator, biotin operon repressor / biotin---[acetyl-CoA-carboxylase] ligase
MKLIKLDAIESTNDFLKTYAYQESLENFTVVTAKTQTKGKGQMGSLWESESGKNLTVSVFVNKIELLTNELFRLNMVVSVAMIEALETHQIPQLSIKWPNDILSANKKIGGILIENLILNHKLQHSIIGIGLNVNQTFFDDLPKASSLAIQAKKQFEIDTILLEIVKHLKINIKLLHVDFAVLKLKYLNLLYKINMPAMFQNNENLKFVGMIQGITEMGKLIITTDSNQEMTFEIKEITMLY